MFRIWPRFKNSYVLLVLVMCHLLQGRGAGVSSPFLREGNYINCWGMLFGSSCLRVASKFIPGKDQNFQGVGQFPRPSVDLLQASLLSPSTGVPG